MIDLYVRFEFFTAVTMKNAVFWDVTLCGFAPCFGCYLLLTLFLARRFLSPWWWRRNVPPIHRFLQEPQIPEDSILYGAVYSWQLCSNSTITVLGNAQCPVSYLEREESVSVFRWNLLNWPKKIELVCHWTFPSRFYLKTEKNPVSVMLF
jgi:hypothetical protein